MSFRLRTFVIVFLSPLLAVAQPGERQIQTEPDLASALSGNHESPSSRELLLKAHSQLVNTSLWSELSDRAATAYNGLLPEQSVAIYEIAIQVASYLQAPKLVA